VLAQETFFPEGTLAAERQIRCVKSISIDSTCAIYLPNPMFDHLLELSHRDNSYKWSKIGFGEEIEIIEIKIRTLSGALLAVSCSKSYSNESNFL